MGFDTRAPALMPDKHARRCPQCGHIVAPLDKARFTCTNPNCDKFMHFTKPKAFARKADIQPLIRRF